MEAATLTRPEPAHSPIKRPPGSRRLRGEPPAAARRRDLVPIALGTLLVGTFRLRIWGIKQGLPYAYNVDEEAHFVPRAIAFFGHDLNPRYFLNPPAFSYVLHGVFDVWF